jgi:hypothetical protein
VSSSPLGRVVDPAALDACEGDRARLAIDVPAAWLDEGADLVLTSPARLPCARCGGGGCDRCARSGALRAPVDATARVILARVAAGSRRGTAGVTLRITRPFGPEHPITQLLLEVRAAATASSCVERVPRALPAAAIDRRGPGWLAAARAGVPWRAVAVGVATVATILFALLGR